MATDGVVPTSGTMPSVLTTPLSCRRLWSPALSSSVILLSEGRLPNPASVTGHPASSCRTPARRLAQIDPWTRLYDFKNKVYLLPKHLDEKVARLHLDGLGVWLTEPTKTQAGYLGVEVAAPYKG